MKKKILIGAVILVAAYITWEQVKGNIFTWYAVNMQSRETAHLATNTPDQICLTWSGEPALSQTVNWRTAPVVAESWVQYRLKGAPADSKPAEIKAERQETTDEGLENDAKNARYTARISGLSPATEYQYRVGDKSADQWSAWLGFTTAPPAGKDFSFLYLGDAQVGLDYYGDLLHRAEEKYPNTLFGIVAGDLVNSGACRNEWDDFFAASAGVFDRKTLVPCLGNHDYQKQEVPSVYLNSFGLPLNGPKDFPPERAYSFTVSDALFIVLDSNLPSEQDQAKWLEETLSQSTAKWKIAIYHHPAYCAKPKRDAEAVFDLWTPLFDRYHLDVALQGHDHSYMRTYPMKAGKRVESAAEGTYYLVTVSGSKYYEQVQHDYAAAQFADTSTYQVINIGGKTLSYHAYDYDHKLRDEFEIKK